MTVDERDEYGWTPEARERKQAAVRGDLGDDAHLLDNPKYVRVGDRFGALILYSDPDRPAGSRYHLVDVGPYLPRDERPTLATSDKDYFLYCENREEDQRAAVMDHWTQRRLRGQAVPFRTSQAEQWVTEHKPAPALEVRCSSKHRGAACRSSLATIYATEHGHLIETQTYPAYDERFLHLEQVLDARASGQLTGTEVDAYLADPSIPYRAVLEDRAGDQLPVIIGCRRHGDATVDAVFLLTEATSTRRTLSIDTAADLIGYPDE